VINCISRSTNRYSLRFSQSPDSIESVIESLINHDIDIAEIVLMDEPFCELEVLGIDAHQLIIQLFLLCSIQ